MKLTKIFFAICMILAPVTLVGCGDGGNQVVEGGTEMTEQEEMSYEDEINQAADDEGQN